MRSLILAMILFGCFISPASAAGVDFVFDLRPLALLVSDDIDDFSVAGATSFSFENHTIDGIGSWVPTARAGIGMETQKLYVDFVAGIGYLWNNAFSGSLFHIDAGLHFKLGPVTLGPHLGWVGIGELDWEERGPDLTFDSTSGAMIGLDLTMGKKIHFMVSLDYLSVDDSEIDLGALNASGWTASRPSIDLSGFALQMGVQGRF